ncbi:tetratricopeptide repeat-containing sensor histidine kinase [Mesonia sp.]|uniref:tetratricopeptide repeat-containing sensor histidine kinase n=1 Tax=Mesonia sp. TaxID=1960830 RepID=UPI00177A2259|nr:tetratricopeptide repeat-containing sensor histidine kinase [Mesonia sp.]HIB38440.1 tetratricopeptide repeat-containing sensor histidine kinase [Mesonia sp.]HIO26806.1 tetratricopeptide repeat-containing sensor histidine kinase [Flavobacteriaceae bacterium]
MRYSLLISLLLLFFSKNFNGQNTTPSDSLNNYVSKVNNSAKPQELLEAFRYFNAKIKNDQSELSEVYNLIYIARIQQKLGVLQESEATATKALQVLENTASSSTKKAYQNTLYNHLGKLYKETGKLKQASYFYKKAVSNASAKQKAILYNNLGNIARDQQNDSTALDYYTKAIALSEQTDNLENLARARDNSGYLFRVSQPQRALSEMRSALELREKLQLQEGLFTSYIHLGEYYQLQQQKQLAKAYFIKAQSIAEQFKNLKYKESALQQLLRMADIPIAKNYLTVKDSLTQLNQNAESNYLALKYQLEKSEQEANLFQLEKEAEAQKKVFYQIIGLLVILIAIAIFGYLKIKHRKEKILQVFNTESRIAKKVHDEVANDVYYLMTKLQNATYQKEDTLHRLEEIYQTSRNISRENNSFPEDENFSDLLKELVSHYQTSHTKIIVKNLTGIDWQTTSTLKKATLYRVLQELFTNMKKHSEASLVLLSFQQKGKNLVINYTDNGKGSELKKRNGLVNTESRMQAIQGKIIFDSEINKGFKAQLIC